MISLSRKFEGRDFLATYPPDPLPLIREGGGSERGATPSLKSLSHLLLRREILRRVKERRSLSYISIPPSP